MECIVCLEDFEENEIIRCCDINCNACICVDCMIRFVNISPNLIKCVGNCESHYLYSEVLVKIKADEDVVCKYRKTINRYLTNITDEKISEKKSVESLIETIRAEKRVFITTFPIAIQSVINIVYKGQLSKITRENKKKIDALIQKTNKKCPNYFCKGLLDLEMKCMICFVQWCEKCEKKLKENHECAKEDIESVELVKNCIKCPKCNVSVLRSYGCDYITCAICKTNFNYVTGTRSIHGGGEHRDMTVIIKPTKTLSETIMHEMDNVETGIILLINKIESLAPKVDICYNKIMKIIDREQQISQDNRLFRLYEKLVIAQSKVKTHNKYMADIEKMYNAKKFDESVLENMVERLE